MNQNKWYHSSWTIGLVSSSFLPIILTFAIDLFKKIPILSTLVSVTEIIYESIKDILNYQIAISNILIFLSVLFILNLLYFKIFRSVEVKKPHFFNYTSDHLKSFYWTWEWELNEITGNYTLTNLKAHCPKCNTGLIYNQSLYRSPEYQCPRCDFDTQVDYNFNKKVESIIIDNVNRKKQSS